jgi:hypothetical protein
MCNTGDCLVVAILNDKEFQNMDHKIEILTNIEYTTDNVEFLCKKIFNISNKYDKYIDQ